MSKSKKEKEFEQYDKFHRWFYQTIPQESRKGAVLYLPQDGESIKKFKLVGDKLFIYKHGSTFVYSLATGQEVSKQKMHKSSFDSSVESYVNTEQRKQNNASFEGDLTKEESKLDSEFVGTAETPGAIVQSTRDKYLLPVLEDLQKTAADSEKKVDAWDNAGKTEPQSPQPSTPPQALPIPEGGEESPYSGDPSSDRPEKEPPNPAPSSSMNTEQSLTNFAEADGSPSSFALRDLVGDMDSRGKQGRDIVNFSYDTAKSGTAGMKNNLDDYLNETSVWNANIDDSHDQLKQRGEERFRKGEKALGEGFEGFNALDQDLQSQHKEYVGAEKTPDGFFFSGKPGTGVLGRTGTQEDKIRELYQGLRGGEDSYQKTIDDQSKYFKGTDESIDSFLQDAKQKDPFKEGFKGKALEHIQEDLDHLKKFKELVHGKQRSKDFGKRKQLELHGLFGTPQYNEIVRRAGQNGLDAESTAQLLNSSGNYLSGLGGLYGNVAQGDAHHENYINNLLEKKLGVAKGSKNVSDSMDNLLGRMRENRQAEGKDHLTNWGNRETLLSAANKNLDTNRIDLAKAKEGNREQFAEYQNSQNTFDSNVLGSRYKNYIDPGKKLESSLDANERVAKLGFDTVSQIFPSLIKTLDDHGSLSYGEVQKFGEAIKKQHEADLQNLWKASFDDIKVRSAATQQALGNLSFIKTMLDNSAMSKIDREAKQKEIARIEKQFEFEVQQAEEMIRQGKKKEGETLLKKTIAAVSNAINGAVQGYAATGNFAAAAGAGIMAGTSSFFSDNTTNFGNPLEAFTAGSNQATQLNQNKTKNQIEELYQKLYEKFGNDPEALKQLLG